MSPAIPQHNATHRNLRGLLLALTLAVAFLGGEMGLMAHEIQHQLDHHNAPCLLCQMAHHLGNAPVTAPFHVPCEPLTGLPSTTTDLPFSGTARRVYRARAPPSPRFV